VRRRNGQRRAIRSVTRIVQSESKISGNPDGPSPRASAAVGDWNVARFSICIGRAVGRLIRSQMAYDRCKTAMLIGRQPGGKRGSLSRLDGPNHESLLGESSLDVRRNCGVLGEPARYAEE